MRRARLAALVAGIASLALVGAACGNEEAGDDRGLLLADRWLRIGEDVRTEVTVYEATLPPDLVELLNPGMTEETDDEDLIALPVHPEGVLLGSFRVTRPDGVNVVYLLYDVAKPDADVEQEISVQLDQTPWQQIGGSSGESLSLVRFQNTMSGDIEGTAALRPIDLEGEPGTSLIYVLQVAPATSVSAPDFELPRSRQLPQRFPADFLLPADATVLELTWQSAPGGSSYQLVALSRESVSDLSEQLRDAISEQGWQLDDDEAVGFATILRFSDPEGSSVGTASIDAFEGDDSFTAVFMQLQVAR